MARSDIEREVVAIKTRLNGVQSLYDEKMDHLAKRMDEIIVRLDRIDERLMSMNDRFLKRSDFWKVIGLILALVSGNAVISYLRPF